ncbi:hypothetical protein RCO48_31250 [Peribacillus frigoritolerans]|nr:hypothetical protein [Peribacillus frigoritolerans]
MKKIETDGLRKNGGFSEQRQVLLTLPVQLMVVFAVIIVICCVTIGSI